MARGRKATGGGGLGRGLSGIIGGGTLSAVGGATAAALFGPRLAAMLPREWFTGSQGVLIGSTLVGAVGYLVLRRFSRDAALGWVAASIAPAVAAQFGPRLSGYGQPDGIDYLPVEGIGQLTDESGDEEAMQGIGEYADETVEV